MTYIAGRMLWGLLAGAAFAQQPTAKGVNFYSLANEIELGRQAADRLGRQLPIVREPKLDAYIALPSSELAKYADNRFTYTFTAYQDRKTPPIRRVRLAMPVDAFLLPAREPAAIAGGPVFVPLSLLAEAPNEPVFAFQPAHAMAHIALRHATRLETKMELVEIGAQTAPQMPELAVEVAPLAFSRSVELEADALAVRIAAQAGYDPEGVCAYLATLDATDETPHAFSPHPSPGRRIQAIRSVLKNLPAGGRAAASGQFDAAKALAAGIR